MDGLDTDLAAGALMQHRMWKLSEAPWLHHSAVRLVEEYLRLPDAWNGDVPANLPEAHRTVVECFPGPALPPGGEVLVATADDDAAGQVLVSPHTVTVAKLERMYVRPGQRRTGLGSMLVHEAIAVATAAGYQRVVLDVLPERHGALRLYRRHGFEPIEPFEDAGRPLLFLGRDLAPTPSVMSPAAAARPPHVAWWHGPR